jgi:hypothetical protein
VIFQEESQEFLLMLADGARKRASELPGGKEMTVFEGDAKQTIKDGMQTELASHEFTVKK